MNQSVINICNLALTRMGGNQINLVASLEEAGEEARLCRRLYPQVLADLLRGYPFAFALDREPLALLKIHEQGRLPFEYAYPAAALKLWRVAPLALLDQDSLFSVQFEIGYGSGGRSVFCDQAKVYALFSRTIEDPGYFDPLFVEALAWSMASELALATNRIREADALSKRALMACMEARSADAGESHSAPAEPFYITSRS
jgi:hypothetical protein